CGFDGDTGGAAVAAFIQRSSARRFVEVAVVVLTPLRAGQWNHGVIDEKKKIAVTRGGKVGAKQRAHLSDLSDRQWIDLDVSAGRQTACVDLSNFDQWLQVVGIDHPLEGSRYISEPSGEIPGGDSFGTRGQAAVVPRINDIEGDDVTMPLVHQAEALAAEIARAKIVGHAADFRDRHE